jgi:hypothetical protein
VRDVSRTVEHRLPNAVMREAAQWFLDEEIMTNFDADHWRRMAAEADRREADPFLRFMPELNEFWVTVDFDSDQDAVDFMLRFVG